MVVISELYPIRQENCALSHHFASRYILRLCTLKCSNFQRLKLASFCSYRLKELINSYKISTKKCIPIRDDQTGYTNKSNIRLELLPIIVTIK
jgi:hypothetical protein